MHWQDHDVSAQNSEAPAVERWVDESYRFTVAACGIRRAEHKKANVGALIQEDNPRPVVMRSTSDCQLVRSHGPRRPIAKILRLLITTAAQSKKLSHS